MGKTKYSGVYTDAKGKYFYQIEMGVDRATGERIQRKSRRDAQGQPFATAYAAHKELIRVKHEYQLSNGLINYNLTYGEFIEKTYKPYYKSFVENSTWLSRQPTMKILTDRFGEMKLRDIEGGDCEQFRIWLLNDSPYSQAYSSLTYTMFRTTLDYAVTLNFLPQNIAKRTKAIPKGKAVVGFWTKDEFEAVLSKVYCDDFYEHMCFVMLWVYYMTGIRVSEGLALWWSDVDLEHKKLRIHHTLDMRNQNNWTRKPYTKTVEGMRTISLDDDTVAVLTEWKAVQEAHGVKHFVMGATDKPTYRSTVMRVISRYAKLADVADIQGKGLRHSHVSYLINEFNANVLHVSKRLGHSSPEITLKHYSHLWSRGDEELAEKMSGNIKFESATESGVDFNGNQSIKY
ncbi:tyrosine-type recombinase/integrase [Secundilactobacillus yichangensis]|uniref:tyrosine-type recombinase/integrase n=1 Tax=Secundilactobacillus yichangensis TaxID=2799580 RepID=UPI00194561A2|nr:site-specific integrase [Secundilactobacillus yichangensis]